jgi:chorismate mutase/prephenate dehydratase
MDLSHFRDQIDAIDDQILELISKRADLAIEVGKFKKKHKQDLYVPTREVAILQRLEQKNPGPLPKSAVRSVFREIISGSLSLEYKLRVVYLGPQGTFTHMAALEKFGRQADLHALRTISAIFEDVERGRSQYGVVPIENSNEGAVTHTLDLFIESDLQITQEHYLEISHNLMNRTGKIEDIRRVYSHTQALEQCRRWLEFNLPHVELERVNSTADAARLAAKEGGDTAAIGNKRAAELYNLELAAERIEDNHMNFTRFLVIGKKPQKPSGNDKTSLLFSFKDEPGILAKMLEPFRKRDLNLMKIESRPVKKRAWEYVFFIDVEGHIETHPIQDAIAELEPYTHKVKITGCYPRSR